MGYIFLFLSIGCGVVGQLLVKWRINTRYMHENIPEQVLSKIIWFAGHLFLDPVLIFSICFTFIAGVAWMAAMTKLDISVAYPFTALSYVSVLLLSAYLLDEPLTVFKLLGVAVICTGIAISCKG